MSFEKRPLADALKELSDMTGVSIVLDVEKAPGPKVELTADFHNVPLECAVRVLADMAGMKSVIMANMLYVTSQANAEILHEDLMHRVAPGTPKSENPSTKEKQ